MWKNLKNIFNCIIIQNNFELPSYRLLGNMDATDSRGKINFIERLNLKFYEYINENHDMYLNDINYVSSCYGLDKWSSDFYYYMYKYALELQAIPYLSFNIARIIKAIYGKNKKAFVLDLDNTLWGGIVGDDGPENISIGPEIPNGQAYYGFHKYLKEYSDMGIILNINSKNDYENAIAGLNNPGSLLKKEDFIIIKANWNPKNINIKDISEELNLGADSFVFVDDNPVERKIVRDYVDGIGIVEANEIENFIQVIDRNGFLKQLVYLKKILKRKKCIKIMLLEVK